MTTETLSAPLEPARPAASWAAILAVAAGAFALVTTEFLPVGLLPQISRDLAITEGQAGLMVTIPGFLAAFAAPATIGLVGRLDRRWVLLFLLGLLAVSNLIVATADSVVALLCGRVLLGVGVGGFWAIGGSLGPRLRPGAEAPRATALIYSGVSLGMVAGVPAGALIGELVGWRLAFGVSTALALAVVGALAWLLPPIKPSETTGLRQVPEVLRLRQVQVGLGASVLVFIAQFAAYTYIGPILETTSGIGPSGLGLLLLGYGVAGFVGNLAGGWAVIKALKATLVAVGLVLGGAMLLLLWAGTNPWVASALVLLWGLAWGVLPIAMQTWMFSAAPDRLEGVAALFVSVAQAAIGGGALAGGLAVDHLGVQAAMGLGAAGSLATALLIGAFRPRPVAP